MKSARSSFPASLLLGGIKGAVLGILAVALALVALAYRDSAFTHFGTYAVEQISWAALAIGVFAILGGATALVRR
jgi:hypothetical protein